MRLTVQQSARQKVRVAIIMGSSSDAPRMKAAAEALTEFGVSYVQKVVSAHRTPKEMYAFASEAESKGYEVIIAGAGGAAHLPGMVASLTTLPVIGVPVNVTKLNGLDALLSVVQMPAGVPVACVAVDNSYNAGLLAVKILGTQDQKLRFKLRAYQEKLRKKVLKMKV
ncbi:MAG: 5-(carboxyamino)imidazole ribonucleotide mutase [Bdellovibrionota bacterium]